MFVAIAKYAPSESDGLPLDEGDVVEVLDSGNPDRWLCRMRDRPDSQGWVPPSYLVARSDEKLDTRSTQEVFREDIIKISNKQQEAVMKRRSSSLSSSSSSIYLDKTKHKCQGHVGTYRHHSNIHDRVVIAVAYNKKKL